MSRGKPVNRTITREAIVDRLQSALQQVDQWVAMKHYENAARYAAKAEALIELLEVDDCGSVGGFDKARGQNERMRQSLHDRYVWLTNLPVTMPIEAVLLPAADWLDANKQEALSGQLRQIIRTS